MLTLAAWLHTLDPVIVRIADWLAIRWYGVSYLAGFACAFAVLRALARRGWLATPAHRVADAMMWFIGLTLVGGRLGYVIFYQPSLAWTFFDTFPWWGGVAINHGGMASHGAMAGLVAAAWRVSRGWRNEQGMVEGRCSMLHVMDALTLAAPFGLFFGRCANFINGELLGKIVSPPGTPGPWWSVQYPHELTMRNPPALTLEQQGALFELAERAAPGRPFGVQMEVLIERSAQYADQLRPLLSSRHPSQLYQAAAEGIVLGGVSWLVWLWQRRGAASGRAGVLARSGVLAAVWLVGYGVLRILTETIRLPDEQFGEAGRPMGLSRGQWLSVAMIVCGGALGAWVMLRAGPRSVRAEKS